MQGDRSFNSLCQVKLIVIVYNLKCTSNMKWSLDKTLELVELFRLNPISWNCKLSDYKNRDKRHDALNEIANSINVEKYEVGRKIKNLSSYFARESKTVRGEQFVNTKSGSGASVYEGKWFAFKSMEFILDRNKP